MERLDNQPLIPHKEIGVQSFCLHSYFLEIIKFGKSDWLKSYVSKIFRNLEKDIFSKFFTKFFS